MEMTLDQIGLMLVQASKSVPKEKGASFEDLMRLARTPVWWTESQEGKLKDKKCV